METKREKNMELSNDTYECSKFMTNKPGLVATYVDDENGILFDYKGRTIDITPDAVKYPKEAPIVTIDPIIYDNDVIVDHLDMDDPGSKFYWYKYKNLKTLVQIIVKFLDDKEDDLDCISIDIDDPDYTITTEFDTTRVNGKVIDKATDKKEPRTRLDVILDRKMKEMLQAEKAEVELLENGVNIKQKQLDQEVLVKSPTSKRFTKDLEDLRDLCSQNLRLDFIDIFGGTIVVRYDSDIMHFIKLIVAQDYPFHQPKIQIHPPPKHTMVSETGFLDNSKNDFFDWTPALRFTNLLYISMSLIDTHSPQSEVSKEVPMPNTDSVSTISTDPPTINVALEA